MRFYNEIHVYAFEAIHYILSNLIKDALIFAINYKKKKTHKIHRRDIRYIISYRSFIAFIEYKSKVINRISSHSWLNNDIISYSFSTLNDY